MTHTRQYNPSRNRPARSYSPIRAIRHEDARTQIERRLVALGVESDALSARAIEPQLLRRLARALRRERRAAHSGQGGYDPLRHLVLARLAARAHGNVRAGSDRIFSGDFFRAPAPKRKSRRHGNGGHR